MCYFDQTRWVCGYWRWGNCREQCEYEWRVGETCGLKFVQTVYPEPSVCKLCLEMERKQRRIEKMEKDVARWITEGDRPTTIERTTESLTLTKQQLIALIEKHEKDINNLAR